MSVKTSGTVSIVTESTQLVFINSTSRYNVANGGSSVATILANIRLFAFAYQWLLMPFIISLNLVSIAICIKSNSHTLRMRANEFVMSLAVADLIIGLFIPYLTAFYVYPSITFNLEYCAVRYAFQQAHTMASVLSILLVTADRYVAVVHPMSYYKTDLLPYYRLAIALVWIYSVISSLALFFWNMGTTLGCSAIVTFGYAAYYYAFWVAPLFGSCLAMTVMYASIFHAAAEQKRRILEEQYRLFQNSCSSGSQAGADAITLQQQQSLKDYLRAKRDRKFSKIMAIVVGAVLICWGPWTILGIFEYHGFFSTKNEIARPFAKCLALTNSMINPLIYVWNIPEFRSTLKRLLHVKRDAQVGPVPSVTANAQDMDSVVVQLKRISV